MTRASALFARGDVAQAIAVRLNMDSHLSQPERDANHEALWAELQRSPLTETTASGPDQDVQGWIALSRLSRSAAPLAAFEEWRRKYPGHAGESQIAASLVMPAPAGQASTANSIPPLALLLPLTGPLANASKAIRAGVDAAIAAGGPDAPRVVGIDTGAGLEAALGNASLQGVSTIIGPLKKEDNAALAARNPSLPVLSLNYLETGRVPPAGYVPFGLAPEDEARAGADEAAASGHLRAVMLAVEGDWGERTAKAYKAQFENRGGVVLQEARFAGNAVDFTAAIKHVLEINAADTRIRALAGTGIKAEAQAAPRGDIDVIFLAVKSAQARLLWPQLRYQGTSGIAAYAPAAASDAGTQELGGLTICDAPWRLAMTGEMAELRGKLANINPRSADAQRLFALGYDAYTLARRQIAGSLVPGTEWPGLSGQLVLDADGAVHRHLHCAAVALPTAVELPPPATEAH
jgi:outer membrane PBP1 activator LpoA protein